MLRGKTSNYNRVVRSRDAVGKFRRGLLPSLGNYQRFPKGNDGLAETLRMMKRFAGMGVTVTRERQRNIPGRGTRYISRWRGMAPWKRGGHGRSKIYKPGKEDKALELDQKWRRHRSCSWVAPSYVGHKIATTLFSFNTSYTMRLKRKGLWQRRKGLQKKPRGNTQITRDKCPAGILPLCKHAFLPVFPGPFGAKASPTKSESQCGPQRHFLPPAPHSTLATSHWGATSNSVTSNCTEWGLYGPPRDAFNNQVFLSLVALIKFSFVPWLPEWSLQHGNPAISPPGAKLFRFHSNLLSRHFYPPTELPWAKDACV